LRTVEGVVCPSFQEATVALGLFRNVNEATYAMEEAASSFSRPGQLRFLFAHLLLDLPSPAVTLWTRFCPALSADFALHQAQDTATTRALQSISRILRANGASLRQFGLPEPVLVERELQMEIQAFAPLQDTLLRRSHQNYAVLNHEQRRVFNAVYSSLGTGGCFFVDGKAGRGKTFLMGTLCDRIRAEGHVVCIVGSTALSVTLYERGRTTHSAFGIPVHDTDAEVLSHLAPTSGRAELLKHAILVLWEELPMANKTAVQCADHLLRSITARDVPFGGKCFVGVGDFRQVAPVTPATTAPASVFDASIRSSTLWQSFQILRLSDPLRTALDTTYSDWLDKVGDGVPPYDTTVDLSHLRRVRTMNEALDFLFPDATLDEPIQCVLRSFLSPFNFRVDEFNGMVLRQLRGDEGTD
ncbi:hypothetical protein LX36DRAFT_542191, partial [Colletotrichum falcatum]